MNSENRYPHTQCEPLGSPRFGARPPVLRMATLEEEEERAG